MAQYQHVVPQVYLKQFGFQKNEFGKEKWFVSVWNIERKNWEENGREIKRFSGKNNIYDLDNCIEISNRSIENDLNGKIEGRFPKIIKRLDKSTMVTENLQLAIAETTANFLCRSLWALDWLKGWRTKENFRDFFDLIIDDKFSDKTKSDSFFFDILTLNTFTEKDVINRLMIFLTSHVSDILCKASITIIKGGESFLFYTSDNPVILRNVNLGNLEDQNMEIFFPISPKYLVYFYWNSNKCSNNSLSTKLYDKAIFDVDKEIYDFFNKTILLEFAENFIICPVNIQQFVKKTKQ